VEAVKLACTKTSSFDLTTRPSTYSALFNLALYQLSLGNHESEAIATLDEAARLCSNQMSLDGYEEVAIDKELLVISSQKAYALQLLGLKKEALELYEKLLSNSSLDPVILAIATNNIQLLKGARDVLDVFRALKLIHTPSIIAKLNSSQNFLIEFNGLIYSILVGKVRTINYFFKTIEFCGY
jgi:tetratricopeptide (TPR) repeat protein